jgi:hypothetical protein
VRYELDRPGLEVAKSEVGLHGFQVRRSPERVINVHEGSAVSGGFEFQFSIILWAEPRIKVMWITLKGLEVCWACIRIRRIGLCPGLVALFGRAPIIKPHASTAFSYVVVVIHLQGVWATTACLRRDSGSRIGAGCDIWPRWFPSGKPGLSSWFCRPRSILEQRWRSIRC